LVENNCADYLIIPVVLLIMFLILVHSVTNQYLDKYLPPMKDMKGYFARGIILVVIYIIVRFIINVVNKNKLQELHTDTKSIKN